MQSTTHDSFLHEDTNTWRFRLFVLAVLGALGSVVLTDLALVAGASEAVPLSDYLINGHGPVAYAAVRGAALAGAAVLVFRVRYDTDKPLSTWFVGGTAALMLANVAWDVSMFTASALPEYMSGAITFGAGNMVTAGVAGAVLVTVAAVPLVRVRTTVGATRRVLGDPRVKAGFAVLLMVGSVFAGSVTFSTQQVTAATADTTDITEADIIGVSDDGTQLVFMQGDGAVIDTRANPLSQPLSSVSAGDDRFVVFAGDGGTSFVELAVYNKDMAEVWNTSWSPTSSSFNVEMSDDGQHVVLNSYDWSKVYDENGTEVASVDSTSRDVELGSDRFLISGPGSSDVTAYDYTGTQVWTLDASTYSELSSVGRLALEEGDTADGDIVYIEDSGVVAVDGTTGDKLWGQTSGDFQRVHFNAEKNSLVSLDNNDGTLAFLDAEDGAVLNRVSKTDAFSGKRIFSSASGERFIYSSTDGVEYFSDTDSSTTAVSTSPLVDDIGAYSTWSRLNTISGTVVDEEGDAVPDATVELWAVNHTSLEESGVTDLEAEADDLLDQAEDPLPPQWQSQSNDGFDVVDDYSDAPGEYALVHKPEAYTSATGVDSASENWLGTGDASGVGAEISDPAVHLEPGEPYEVSIWDPDADSSSLLSVSDPVEGQLPGGITSGEVVVQRLGPSGSVVNEFSPNTTERYVTHNALGQVKKTHETVRVRFDAGVYRLSTTDGSAEYYVIVGDEKELARTIAGDLQDEANTLTDRAQYLEDELAAGNFTRTTVTTNADGQFSVDKGVAMKTVAVQAYKIDGELLDTVTDPTVEDLRDVVEANDYNGSVYLPTQPQRVTPPAQDVTVRVTEESTVPYANTSDVIDKYEWLIDLLKNDHFGGLDSVWQEPLSEMTDDEIDALYDRVLVEHVKGSELEPVFSTVADEAGVDPVIDTEHPRSTKENQLALVNEVLSEAAGETSGDNDDGDVNVGEDGTVTIELPSDTAINTDPTVIVNYANGTSEVINGTVDNGLISGDTITVEHVLTNDTISAEYEIIGVDEDGNLIRETETVSNPAFSGDVPSIEGVTANTVRPGVGDTVRMSITPDENVASINSNETVVYAPDGSVVSHSVDNGELSFQASQEGTYTAALGIESTSGHVVTEAVRVEAASERADLPPGVHLRTGPVGSYAVATEGVDSADIEQSSGGAKTSVTARFDDGDVPGAVHVYGLSSQSPHQEYTTRLVDSTGSVISSDAPVHYHVKSLDEDVPVYSAGSPVVEADRYHEGGATIIPSEAESGVSEVSVNNNPGWIDKAGWWVDKIVSGGLPLSSIPVPVTGGESGVLALSAVPVSSRVMGR